jgi:hypothetical protein
MRLIQCLVRNAYEIVSAAHEVLMGIVCMITGLYPRLATVRVDQREWIENAY